MSESQLHWEDVSALWEPYEEVADSLEDLLRFTARLNTGGRQFVWRGQANHNWGVTSSLYRRFFQANKEAQFDFEQRMSTAERKILSNLKEWGFHYSQSAGQYSALAQLAMLQHYGFPTRLIDVSYNPLVAAWFCVENPSHHKEDGRIFAIEVDKKSVEFLRNGWEEDPDLPWRGLGRSNSKANKKQRAEWRTSYYVWRPPRINPRLAAQDGGFLVGGFPLASANVDGKPFSYKVPRRGRASQKYWRMDDLRFATSIALRPYKIPVPGSRGRRPSVATYVLRIKADAKQEILLALKNIYGYSYATLFPDYSGVAENANKIFAAEWAQMVSQ